MNFKLRKNKFLTSLIIPMVFWIILAIFKSKITTGLMKSILEFHNFSKLISTSNLVTFVIEFFIVYIIYSLFQNKYL